MNTPTRLAAAFALSAALLLGGCKGEKKPTEAELAAAQDAFMAGAVRMQVADFTGGCAIWQASFAKVGRIHKDLSKGIDLCLEKGWLDAGTATSATTPAH